MNSLFLTVGEKIRQARQQFNLKQGSFRNYGITQHYLSMIETNKRQAPEQTLRDIYDAFINLTNGEIESLYTFEEFCLPMELQVSRWLDQQLDSAILPQKYEELILVAEKYSLAQYMISIDERMGEYYFKVQDYLMMAYYYRRAIGNSLKFRQNPASLYFKFGRCLRKIGKYDEAVVNLCLACTAGKELTEDSGLVCDAHIYLALTYHRLKEYRLGLEVVNELLKNKDNLKEGRYVGTLIVKELCMRRLEGAEKSRKYLYELLDSDILNQFPSFSHYVYHSLGWNYLESQKYEKALEALQKALPLRPKQLDKAITTLLIGRIYFEIGQYEEAQKYYSETKETILLSESLRTKRLWIDEQLDLYCKLNQIHQVKELFIELKSLVDIDKFPESMLYELKTSMYKRFEGLSPLRREEYLFLYNFFTS